MGSHDDHGRHGCGEGQVPTPVLLLRGRGGLRVGSRLGSCVGHAQAGQIVGGLEGGGAAPGLRASLEPWGPGEYPGSLCSPLRSTLRWGTPGTTGNPSCSFREGQTPREINHCAPTRHGAEFTLFPRVVRAQVSC